MEQDSRNGNKGMVAVIGFACGVLTVVLIVLARSC